MSDPTQKNLTKQAMTPQSRKDFLARFMKDCARAFRGGITEEELVASVHEAVCAEVHEEEK